jgi:imidazolonepropionase-like amidohydrolase
MSALAFVGGTLVDATGAPPLLDAAVVVRDGRIDWVGPASGLDRGSGLELFDVSGKHLVPGLLDANVHFVLHVEPDVLFRYDVGDYDELVLEAAQVALRTGFTTVFDTWGPLQALIRVRDRINRGEALGSRFLVAGNIIGNDGPWSMDFFPSTGAALSQEMVAAVNHEWEQGVGAELTWMSAESVRERVREYIATSGIDFVKYASSSHAYMRFLALSPRAQQAIVEEAHAAGMIAQACSQAIEPLRAAIDAGVDLLQHADVTGMNPIPDDVLELIVERRLPTVSFMNTTAYIEAINDRAGSWHGSDFGRVLRVKDENNRRFIAAGAKLLMAHDCGLFGPTAKTSPFFATMQTGVPDYPYYLGESHLYWMRAAFERGLEPMKALQAATRNIAEAYHCLDEVGTVEVGKRADLVILQTDPLADPDSYGRITDVVLGGRIVDRDRLPEHPILTHSRES